MECDCGNETDQLCTKCYTPICGNCGDGECCASCIDEGIQRLIEALQQDED